MFMAGMGSSSPELMLATGEAAKMSARAQVKMALLDLGKRTWSSARSFGKIATIYSAAECGIESVRGGSYLYHLIPSLVPCQA